MLGSVMEWKVQMCHKFESFIKWNIHGMRCWDVSFNGMFDSLMEWDVRWSGMLRSVVKRNV